MNIFSCILGLNVTSVTYTFSAGTTIVAAEHNTNMNDLETAIDAIALSTFGVTASSAELNYAGGTILGTVVAGKMVAVDSNKDISEFRNVGFSGTLTMGASSSMSANGQTVTDDQVSYLNDVTSDIQAQLDAKPDGLTDLGVTASAAEINQALDGISANVTDTNLNTLTAGASSDAKALHKHEWGYESSWTSVVANTEYTFAHGLGTVPKKVLILWSDSNPGSYQYEANINVGSGAVGARMRMDGTNIKVIGQGEFGIYYNGSGYSVMGSGYLKVFADL